MSRQEPEPQQIYDSQKIQLCKEIKPLLKFTDNFTMPPQNWDSLPIEFYRFQIVVDGRLVDSSDGQTYHNVNPSSLEPNHEVPVSTSDDVDRAVAAAKKAAPSWAKVPWDERKGRLLEFANALEAHTEAFSRMLVKENGKPVG